MKKLIAISLIGLIVFFLFSGCVQKPKTDETTGTTVKDTQDVKAANEDLEKEADSIDSAIADIDSSDTEDLLDSEEDLDVDINEEDIQ